MNKVIRKLDIHATTDSKSEVVLSDNLCDDTEKTQTDTPVKLPEGINHFSITFALQQIIKR